MMSCQYCGQQFELLSLHLVVTSLNVAFSSGTLFSSEKALWKEMLTYLCVFKLAGL